MSSETPMHLTPKELLDISFPTIEFPIEDPRRFISWVEGAVGGCTLPPFVGVKNHYVSSRDKKSGFVATFIPKSNHSPHQALIGKKYFYIRAGSSFLPTPYQVLAGMFGKRPQPVIFINYVMGPAKVISGVLHLEVGLMIRNDGPGIARDIYINSSPID